MATSCGPWAACSADDGPADERWLRRGAAVERWRNVNMAEGNIYSWLRSVSALCLRM